MWKHRTSGTPCKTPRDQALAVTEELADTVVQRLSVESPARLIVSRGDKARRLEPSRLKRGCVTQATHMVQVHADALLAGVNTSETASGKEEMQGSRAVAPASLPQLHLESFNDHCAGNATSRVSARVGQMSAMRQGHKRGRPARSFNPRCQNVRFWFLCLRWPMCRKTVATTQLGRGHHVKLQTQVAHRQSNS